MTTSDAQRTEVNPKVIEAAKTFARGAWFGLSCYSVAQLVISALLRLHDKVS